MPKIVELHHPLAKHHLAILRDHTTESVLFRNQIRLLSMLLAVRATEDLSLATTEIQTPLTRMRAEKIAQRIAIIPILRAGLGLVEPILELIPSAEVWHLGMYRDEETAKPIEYYCKLPEHDPADVAWILDPMLATGGSICMAMDILKRWGVRDIRILSLLGTPEGIAQVHRQHPEVRIWVASIDRKLNAANYILPGLGDAGDRQFNTLIR